jgi:pyruvate decarboxylase
VTDATFPNNTSYITQIFWSSIGFTVGACLGALIAARETKNPGRVILIVGDGSLQMTAQEIGSYIRFGFTPIIFVINNNGYSIERAINGEKQTYNDISMLWDHQKMLEFFGARKETGIESRSVACKTVEELEAVFSDESFVAAKSIQVCFRPHWRIVRQKELLIVKSGVRDIHGSIRLSMAIKRPACDREGQAEAGNRIVQGRVKYSGIK